MAKHPVKRPMNKYLRWLIQAGSGAGAIVAIVGAWHLFGGPVPAWSSDLVVRDRAQAELAVEVYDRKVRGYLASPAPADPANRQIWEEDLRQARKKLDEFEKRRIELSK